jgi:hypothetical protein
VASSWWHIDIALGRNDQPLIAYCETNSSVKFARRDGPGNWLFRTLDPGGSNSCRPSICYDRPYDDLHVAFYPTMSSTELKHAYSWDNGDNWSVETVTNTGGVTSSSSCPGSFASDGLWLIGTQMPGYKLGLAIENINAVAEQASTSLARLTATPNPCRGFVRLSLLGPGTGEVSLFDRTGRLVRRAAASNGSARLDVRGLPAGVYVARTRSTSRAQTQVVVAR